MDISELIRLYRAAREELDEARRYYNNLEKELKEEMAGYESQMLDISNKLGVDSFKTPSGTAFRVTKTYARLSENGRELREQYAKQTGDFSLFTSHVNKTRTKELVDDGVNVAEIGIDWVTEAAISFRKPTK